MQENDETTRQRVADALRSEPTTPSALARRFDVPVRSILTHVEHVSRSVDGSDERVLVAPPTCQDCGFEGFDDPINLPSRCPSCKSESVSEPAFTIE